MIVHKELIFLVVFSFAGPSSAATRYYYFVNDLSPRPRLFLNNLQNLEPATLKNANTIKNFVAQVLEKIKYSLKGDGDDKDKDYDYDSYFRNDNKQDGMNQGIVNCGPGKICIKLTPSEESSVERGCSGSGPCGDNDPGKRLKTLVEQVDVSEGQKDSSDGEDTIVSENISDNNDYLSSVKVPNAEGFTPPPDWGPTDPYGKWVNPYGNFEGLLKNIGRKGRNDIVRNSYERKDSNFPPSKISAGNINVTNSGLRSNLASDKKVRQVSIINHIDPNAQEQTEKQISTRLGRKTYIKNERSIYCTIGRCRESDELFPPYFPGKEVTTTARPKVKKRPIGQVTKRPLVPATTQSINQGEGKKYADNKGSNVSNGSNVSDATVTAHPITLGTDGSDTGKGSNNTTPRQSDDYTFVGHIVVDLKKPDLVDPGANLPDDVSGAVNFTPDYDWDPTKSFENDDPEYEPWRKRINPSDEIDSNKKFSTDYIDIADLQLRTSPKETKDEKVGQPVSLDYIDLVKKIQKKPLDTKSGSRKSNKNKKIALYNNEKAVSHLKPHTLIRVPMRAESSESKGLIEGGQSSESKDDDSDVGSEEFGNNDNKLNDDRSTDDRSNDDRSNDIRSNDIRSSKKRLDNRFQIIDSLNEYTIPEARGDDSVEKETSETLESLSQEVTTTTKRSRKIKSKARIPGKPEHYMQSHGRLYKEGRDFRKRLQNFLPKRYHWDPDDFQRLGYFWFNGPQGQTPGPWRIQY